MSSAPGSPPPDLEIVASSYAAAMDRIASRARGPVLQIGSRASILDTKATNWRRRLASLPFVGLDIAAGDNVDVVGDIAGDLADLRTRLDTAEFGTIICAHVLEHVRQPWCAARNIEQLLMPGGMVFIQVPWVQAYHPFPEDYWRLSFAGVKSLFDRINFDDAFYSGGSSDRIYTLLRKQRPVIGGDMAAIEAELFQVLLGAAENSQFLNSLGKKRLTLSRGYMPVMVVNMIGTKAK
jgi:hypothetical protein